MTSSLKELIPIETRISMLQTCYNTAGNNYQGRRVKPLTISNYANKLYQSMMQQIKATEANVLLIPKEITKKQISPKKVQLLLEKLIAEHHA